MGDFLQDLPFCEAVVLELCRQCDLYRNVLGPGVVSYVWEHTSPTCLLRKILKTLWLSRQLEITIQKLQTSNNELPQDVLVDLLQELIRRRPDLASESFGGETGEEARNQCRKIMKDARLANGEQTQ